MEFEALRVLYLIFSAFLVALLYGYAMHLYKSDRSGQRDYEKYSKMALDDDFDSGLVEAKKDW